MAPYKNNIIGGLVVGLGVLGTVYAFFPGIFETNIAGTIAAFPDSL